MTMRLPTAPKAWSQDYQRILNATLENSDRTNRKLGRDIELGVAANASIERLILHAPDGTRYEVTVDNAGLLGTTLLT